MLVHCSFSEICSGSGRSALPLFFSFLLFHQIQDLKGILFCIFVIGCSFVAAIVDWQHAPNIWPFKLAVFSCFCWLRTTVQRIYFQFSLWMFYSPLFSASFWYEFFSLFLSSSLLWIWLTNNSQMHPKYPQGVFDATFNFTDFSIRNLIRKNRIKCSIVLKSWTLSICCFLFAF